MIRHCIRNTSRTRSCWKQTCQSSTSTEKWDLQAAICLEKRPKVLPQLSELETQFQKVLSQVEMENSLKSDFELRNENDM